MCFEAACSAAVCCHAMCVCVDKIAAIDAAAVVLVRGHPDIVCAAAVSAASKSKGECVWSCSGGGVAACSSDLNRERQLLPLMWPIQINEAAIPAAVILECIEYEGRIRFRSIERQLRPQ